jgi:hypothetical protein
MKTEIVCIIDRSGSMESIKDDAIGGFNTFLEAQKAQQGEALMTLILFDHEMITLYEGIPLAAVAPTIDDLPQRPRPFPRPPPRGPRPARLLTISQKLWSAHRFSSSTTQIPASSTTKMRPKGTSHFA